MHCDGDEALEVGKEAMCLRQDGAELFHFPYHFIRCWGSNAARFKLDVLREGGETMRAEFATSEGKLIEKSLLTAVHSLMKTMKHETMEQASFDALLRRMDETDGSESPRHIVASHDPTRKLTAHQVMTFRKRYEDDDFVRVDLAVHLKCFSQKFGSWLQHRIMFQTKWGQ